LESRFANVFVDVFDKRVAAAKHQVATEAVLMVAIGGGDFWVRQAAVGNPNTTEAMLVVAAKDWSQKVRLAAVGSRNRPEAAVERLVRSACQIFSVFLPGTRRYLNTFAARWRLNVVLSCE
jgi:hypothetical protein